MEVDNPSKCYRLGAAFRRRSKPISADIVDLLSMSRRGMRGKATEYLCPESRSRKFGFRNNELTWSSV
jgi:hypothetical protein